jgi:hypothetical protein
MPANPRRVSKGPTLQTCEHLILDAMHIKTKIMSIELDVKFSDSLLVCLAILAHNI